MFGVFIGHLRPRTTPSKIPTCVPFVPLSRRGDITARGLTPQERPSCDETPSHEIPLNSRRGSIAILQRSFRLEVPLALPCGQGRAAAFIGPNENHFVILDADKTGLDLYVLPGGGFTRG
ncbi:hypothetical protein RHMOL_Rhmol08G0128500 [Rhododendron molle]|nr:hypothetical protein RHMOL_Rhmol08G0128500 [Rhododendron molle]